jgi:CheY-like chemotaxis protein
MAKILIVEDDTSLSEIYTIRLQAEGYQVVTARDGEEGLAVAVREKPDLILSDIMMPRMSGFSMIEVLKDTPQTAHIKIVVMTALDGEDRRAEGMAKGADAYMVKSQVGIEDVVTMVKEVLAAPAAAVPTAVQPAAAAPATAVAAPATAAAPVVAAAPIAPEAPTQPVVTPAPAPTQPALVAEPAAPTADEPAMPVTPVAPAAPVALTTTPETTPDAEQPPAATAE